jgi:hypothetical protein
MGQRITFPQTGRTIAERSDRWEKEKAPNTPVDERRLAAQTRQFRRRHFTTRLLSIWRA